MMIEALCVELFRRAARFLYLQRTSFAGKVGGRTYGVALRAARFDLTKIVRFWKMFMSASAASPSNACLMPTASNAMTDPRHSSISIHPIGTARIITARASLAGKISSALQNSSQA